MCCLKSESKKRSVHFDWLIQLLSLSLESTDTPSSSLPLSFICKETRLFVMHHFPVWVTYGPIGLFNSSLHIYCKLDLEFDHIQIFQVSFIHFFLGGGGRAISWLVLCLLIRKYTCLVISLFANRCLDQVIH